MSKDLPTTVCKDAIKKWQEKSNEDPTTAKKVDLMCTLPPIRKMEPALNTLLACEHLALSTNAIDRIGSLGGLRNLKILSLGRNLLKRFEKLEEVASSLEQLWVSYNDIEKVDGIQMCKKLKVLYMSNNKLKGFDELTKLRELPLLEELLLVGNPCYEGLGVPQRRIEVLRRLPKLKKLDGAMVGEDEREQAASMGDNFES